MWSNMIKYIRYIHIYKYMDILEIPEIQSTYIIFNRLNNNIIQNNITYRKNIKIDDEKNIDKIWLLNNDNIIKNVKGRKFKINEQILMIQRYLHNDLNFSYKDILNVEILYTVKDSSINIENERYLYRYPNRERETIDFEATILDTFIECDLNRENIMNNDKHMYIIVMVCNNPIERKNIGELVNRYLFIENIDRYANRNIPIRLLDSDILFPPVNRNIPYGFSHNNNDSFYSNNIFSDPNIDDFNFIEDEKKNNYLNRIQEFKEERNNELNSIFRDPHRTYPTNFIINNQSNIVAINSISDLTRTYPTDNIINNQSNIVAINSISDLTRTYPTDNIINKSNIYNFLTSLEFDEKCESDEYKKIKIKEQINCPICISDYKNNEMISYINTCNHLFHTNCIYKWLTNFNNICPICRTILDESTNNLKN